MRSLLSKFLFFAALGAVCASSGSTFAKDKPASWKEIEDALLRVNDTPVKDWGVYQTGKKRDPLLIQMNNRFLLIRIHDRQLFEFPLVSQEVPPAVTLHGGSDNKTDGPWRFSNVKVTRPAPN